ncbi:MAG TPA: serine hydrolase domain-containing protein [Lapillicoccus sp.]|nr:serine hydrolase domain-containing protein [Lapillicoccus sp.]
MLKRLLVVTIVAVLALAGCTSNDSPSGGVTATVPSDAQSKQIADLVTQKMAEWHLRAALVKVTKGDQTITEQAFGTSMDNVPATTDMRFRNGAVAFAYVSTLLLKYVDNGTVKLDDPIVQWEPTLPFADKVTLRMLTNQTSGYPDFEDDPAWLAAFNDNPFHIFTYEERLKYAFGRPQQFAPGTNWSYAHTNFMILGEILAKIGGKPLDQLIAREVFAPMGLEHTVATPTSAIPEPALHSFSTERHPDNPFYEEATYWNSQWGTPMGANETTTIDDLATSAAAVGTGTLLSPSSYKEMTDSKLIGFGTKQPDCVPSCFTQVDAYNYGLGVVRSGAWIIQNPLLSGVGVAMAYLPSEKVSIAVAVTFQPEGFEPEGIYKNRADYLFRSIGALVTPQNPPPVLPG